MKPNHRPALILLALPFLALLACAAPGLTPPQPTLAAATAALPSLHALPSAAAATNTAVMPAAAPTTTAPAPSGKATATRAAPPPANPSPTPGGPLPVELALSSPQPAPNGILPQVGAFQSGGGSGYGGGADCGNQPGGPRWCNALNGGVLLLTETYAGMACGFGAGELGAQVRLPDGSTQPVRVAGEPPRCREITYQPDPTAPLGKYQVMLSQGAAQLSDTFVLTAPISPEGTLFQSCGWLAGLPPGQALRLLAFGLFPASPADPAANPGLAIWRFLSETRLTPNPAGSLLACPDASSRARYPEFIYLAYPAGAGAAPLLLGDADLLQQFQGVCANGPRTRLAVSQKARVMVQNLPLFSDPALNARSLALLKTGAVVSILNGPACPPQGPWTWQVKTADHQTGWLAEADQTTYFLAPQP